MRPAIRLAALLLLLWPPLAPSPAPAQGLGIGGQDGQPLDVEADEGIEWRRDEQIYVARGKAKAVRGDTTVRADVLIAHYRPKAGGQTEVWKLEAIGTVSIASPTETAYGDRGVYDIDGKILVLTGKGLKLVTQTETITSRDSLEYWEERKLAVARGDALAVRPDRELRADVLTARFKPDAEGKLQLERIDAFGQVDVRTTKENARGEKGVYTPDTGIATLVGNVRLTQGKNVSVGDVAQMNLKTGISRILKNAEGERGGRRVRALIVPEENKGK